MYKLKQSIQEFKRYQPNTIEYDIKLDANESRVNEQLVLDKLSISNINLYPDHYTNLLREKIATLYDISMNEVIVGSGSSELLELVTKTFLNPGETVLSIEPSFVMYEKYTKMSGGMYQSYPTNKQYQVDIDGFIKEAQNINPKLIFLCTPNNPTGAIIKKEDVLKILDNVDAIVVVDEAYMEFSESNESVIDCINNYQNLIVNRTFSKAFALAGARLGYFIANKTMIEALNTIKTPYSVTSLSQQLGVIALSDLTYLKNNIESVKKNRNILFSKMKELGIKTYPSNTNFIFCEYTKKDLKKELESKRILIRGFGNGTYRITIGTSEQNNGLIRALEEII